jgi:hypothetical protein
MAAAPRVNVWVEDAGGSFRRLINESPKVARELLQDALDKTAFSLAQRMRSKAPVGPDAPHIKDHVTTAGRGLSRSVGYINATTAAGPVNKHSIASVALFNEYMPNQQPFMRPAAEAEGPDFAKRVTQAMQQLERHFKAPESIGTGGSTSSTFFGTRRGAAGTGGQVRGN